ncbi:DUF1641 domain-containing protein [Heyndrickxia acidicola]|uniref:DUF1641 domain-containing protein n=1 Tax=Heyndrickxia acidicola TaxID=209389 RepID=A0ABU6MAF9_9BACI|nr:DUF1641 domain-containing protein [Heyndrickxia acidicola]MED1201649.1 DUF1641 domain-containing protein [Heyndrickxia acidicola]
MAKAVKTIKRIELTEEEIRKNEIKQIEDALLSHKDAVLEVLQIVQHMQDKGILAILRGLFGQGEQVLDVIVKKMNHPETTNFIKNILLMAGTLGTVDVKQLEPVILKVNSGIARLAEKRNEDENRNEQTGYFDLIRSIKDPDVNRSITMLLTFLKGMGQDTAHNERNTQEPHRQKIHGHPE